MKSFRWNQWNIDHIAEHGLAPFEAEHVVNHAVRPWPEDTGEGRLRVLGVGPDGTYLNVGFIYSPPGVVYVIHARPMTDKEKRRYRRRMG